jgi:hypothetical protein
MTISLIRAFPGLKRVFSVVCEDGGDASLIFLESNTEVIALGGQQYRMKIFA